MKKKDNTRVTVAVLKAKLDIMHDDVKIVKDCLTTLTTETALNSAFRRDHKRTHSQYAILLVAAAGLVTGALYFFLNFVFK